MSIDWYTVIAQAINFLILVWLMKRFLYKPILHAIDEREKRIAAELANADSKQAEAQQKSEEFKGKNEEIDQQRNTLMTNATNEANAERQRIITEARQTADDLMAKRQEMLISEAHNLNQSILSRTQQEVFAITRKTLADLATASLEERMVDVFIRRLHEMDKQEKESLAQTLHSLSGPAVIRSAFEMPDDQRAVLQNALNEIFSVDIKMRFETNPELISGIELTSNGQKAAWSIADYLVSMEQSMSELLKEKDIPAAKISETETRSQ